MNELLQHLLGPLTLVHHIKNVLLCFVPHLFLWKWSKMTPKEENLKAYNSDIMTDISNLISAFDD